MLEQVGDWGRNGQFNQSLVAAAMAQEAKKTSPLFIISTGDNFYESMHLGGHKIESGCSRVGLESQQNALNLL